MRPAPRRLHYNFMETDEPADSQVGYGTTTAYDISSALNSATTTTHQVALSGLSASTTYHYIVKSRDAAGNFATSTGWRIHNTYSSVRSDFNRRDNSCHHNLSDSSGYFARLSPLPLLSSTKSRGWEHKLKLTMSGLNFTIKQASR